MSAGGLYALNYNIAQMIEPRPLNYKLIRSSNSCSSNLSRNMRHSQIMKLDGQSQQVGQISRMNGQIHFGNGYLGQTRTLNYLGKMEGMPGGSGSPPTNKFYK